MESFFTFLQKGNQSRNLLAWKSIFKMLMIVLVIIDLTML